VGHAGGIGVSLVSSAQLTELQMMITAKKLTKNNSFLFIISLLSFK
jgi:hypothetical protein